MMTRYLSTQGLRCSENRDGQFLKRVAAGYHAQWQSNTHQQTNPIPYRADYFGEKVRIDRNEKLIMFGIMDVCAVDGYSGKIVGFVTMPHKNNLLIYQYLYMWVVVLLVCYHHYSTWNCFFYTFTLQENDNGIWVMESNNGLPRQRMVFNAIY